MESPLKVALIPPQGQDGRLGDPFLVNVPNAVLSTHLPVTASLRPPLAGLTWRSVLRDPVFTSFFIRMDEDAQAALPHATGGGEHDVNAAGTGVQAPRAPEDGGGGQEGHDDPGSSEPTSSSGVLLQQRSRGRQRHGPQGAAAMPTAQSRDAPHRGPDSGGAGAAPRNNVTRAEGGHLGTGSLLHQQQQPGRARFGHPQGNGVRATPDGKLQGPAAGSLPSTSPLPAAGGGSSRDGNGGNRYGDGGGGLGGAQGGRDRMLITDPEFVRGLMLRALMESAAEEAAGGSGAGGYGGGSEDFDREASPGEGAGHEEESEEESEGEEEEDVWLATVASPHAFVGKAGLVFGFWSKVPYG